MTQLILDAGGLEVTLPESQHDGYKVQKKALSVDVEMVTGRMVRELRGMSWTISYQYGYFDTEMKNKVIEACEKGLETPIYCGFLPQENAQELVYDYFFITSFTRPKFFWSRTGSDNLPIPMWGDFSLELRQVRPSEPDTEEPDSDNPFMPDEGTEDETEDDTETEPEGGDTE